MTKTDASGNSPVSTWLLHELVREHSAQYLYAIISPILHPDWQDRWQVCAQSDCWRHIYWPANIQSSDDPLILLRLIEGNAAETLLLWTSEVFDGLFAPLLFESNLDWSQAQQFWQQRLVAHYPTGTLAALPCHATDVFPRLWFVLTEQQQMQWLADVGRIYRPELPGWSLLAGRHSELNSNFDNFSPLYLNDEQYEFLVRPARRYEQVKALFGRLSLYHQTELSVDQITKVYLGCLDAVEKVFPTFQPTEHEFIAQRCFVWGRQYYHLPEFQLLIKSNSPADALTKFQLQCESQIELAAKTDFYNWLTP